MNIWITQQEKNLADKVKTSFGLTESMEANPKWVINVTVRIKVMKYFTDDHYIFQEMQIFKTIIG